MKKTFFKRLEIDAKKGNEMVEKSLRYDLSLNKFTVNITLITIQLYRFYEALVEADRSRSNKPQKGKSSGSEKA